MKLLFKTTNLPNGTIATVGHSNFKNHYPAVNRNMAWETLLPYIRQATKNHVLRWVGYELYNDLATKYEADTVLTTEQAEVLEALQDAVAYYTIFDAMPFLNISIADMGVQQPGGSDSSTTPTSQWAFKNALWAALSRADTQLDQVMKDLETKYKSVAYFDLWRNSSAQNIGSSAFFRTSQELANHINTQGARRVFVVLLPYLRRVEDTWLKAVTCTGLFDLLAGKMRTSIYSEGFLSGADNTFTTKQVELIKIIQRYVANESLAEAIPHLTVTVEAEGFRLLSQGDTFDDKKPITNSFHLESVKALKYKCEETAKTAKADLIAYLYDNADDFPEFKTSACYSEPSTSSGCWPDQGAVMF